MAITKKTLREVEVAEKRVLVRADFDVPVNLFQHITDDARIRAALPTIRFLRERGARVILMAHRGSPQGECVAELSLAPVAHHLSELLDTSVFPLSDCVGPEIAGMVSSLRPGQVVLLENLRFHWEEQYNERAFARQLAALGDVYVADAFRLAPRAFASTVRVARYLPAVAGLALERELTALDLILEHPQHPCAILMGGEEMTAKMAVLEHLAQNVDMLLAGGVLANTLLKAEGIDVGDSPVEDTQLEAARAILARARAGKLKLFLPTDVVVADRYSPCAATQTVSVDQVPLDWRILDLGPRTVERFSQALTEARTLLWNGALGVTEMPPFAHGTQTLLEACGEYTRTGAMTLLIGDAVATLAARTAMTECLTHVSTGERAALALLQGQILPGIAALQEKPVYHSVTHGKAHR